MRKLTVKWTIGGRVLVIYDAIIENQKWRTKAVRRQIKWQMHWLLVNLPLGFDQTLLVNGGIWGIDSCGSNCIAENKHTQHKVKYGATDYQNQWVVPQRNHVHHEIGKKIKEEDHPWKNLQWMEWSIKTCIMDIRSSFHFNFFSGFFLL